MLRGDSKVKEIWGRQFRIVRKGLDEAEVFAFISRLIEQNSELSRKLEHVDSLKRLAENAVIEADKQAESIKIETREEADRKAEEIITQAVEQTKAEAKRIIAEAEKSSRDRIAASEQLAQDMLKAAEEKARAQAEKIIAEAEEKARAQAEGQTKAEVERIIAEAEEKARAQAEEQTKAEAERIIAEAEKGSRDRIAASEQLAQDMLRAAEEKAEAQPGAEKLAQEKLSVAEQKAKDIEKTTTRSREGEGKAPQPSRTEAVVRGPAGTVGGELRGETSLGEEEGDEKEGPALYRGVVEVAIPPPVAMSNMLKLHKRLTGTRQISVLDVSGSAGKGVIIKLFLRSPTPLIDMLENLPQVYEVAVAKKQAHNTHPPQHRPNEAAAIRIILTLRK